MRRHIITPLAAVCFASLLQAQDDAQILARLRKARADNLRKGGSGEIRKLAEQCDKLPTPPKACAEVWDWYGLALQTDRRAQTLQRSEALYSKALALIGDSADNLQAAALALELESQAIFALGDETRGKELGARAVDYRKRSVAALQPAMPPSETIYRVGGDVAAPSITRKIEAEYSEEARLLKYSGSVQMSLVVTASGGTANLRIVKPLGFGLDEQAARAVMQWRFRLGLRNGQPVNVQAQIELSFKLL